MACDAQQVIHPSDGMARGGLALVVEDNSEMRCLLIEALSCLGYQAVGAGNGWEALPLIAANDYVLILCDIEMPLLDGMELFRATLAERPDNASRFVFVTGGWRHIDHNFLAETGQPCVPKPFTFERLREAINTLHG